MIAGCSLWSQMRRTLLLITTIAATARANEILSSVPTIRIAYLYRSDEWFTPVRFMMSHFHSSNRTILPDFDVIVDGIEFKEESGEAEVKIIELLGPDSPTYHAFAGPWGKFDCAAIVRLTAAARMLHIMKGDNAEFGNERHNYPYAFRSLRSMNGIIDTWMYLVSQNAWYSVLSLWWEAGTLDASYLFSAKYGINNTAVLAESQEEEEDQWLVESWKRVALDHIRARRLRVVMTYIDKEYVYSLVCDVHRAPISGIQWFTRGSFAPGWFLNEFAPRLGDCTPDEMYSALRGYISTLHTPLAPGVNFQGFFEIPVLDTDESRVPLTCMPDLDAHAYYNSGEHLIMSYLDGAIRDDNLIADAQHHLFNSGSETDMVCAVLLALHDAIYNKGVPLSAIERRDAATFDALVDSMTHVEFQGAPGTFRFENTVDPEVIYYAINQWATDFIADNYSAQVTALVTFPEGSAGFPVLHVVDEAVPLIWQDGSTGLGPKPELARFEDCGLSNSELIWDRCEPCAAGRAYDALLQRCRTCQAGAFQNTTGQSICITAEPGWYIRNVSNPTEQSLCPVGYECPQAGTQQPNPCSPGKFAGEEGSAECRLCPLGTFQSQPQASTCTSCEDLLQGSLTASIASTSQSACVCPVGSFRGTTEDSCSPCPEGMECKQGSDLRNLMIAIEGNSEVPDVGPYPEVKPGYMTIRSDPLLVYKCKHEDHCPGGMSGSCARHRDSSTIACGQCIGGAHEVGIDCERCDDEEALSVVAATCVVVGAVVITTILVNGDVHKMPAASLMIIAVSSLLFTRLQTLGIFNQMEIPWMEPVKTALRLAQFLNFDFRVLKLGCMIGEDPVQMYGLRLALAPLAVPCMLCTLLIKKYGPRIGKPRTRILVELSNAIGTMFSFFFISIVLSAMNPYICYKHPGSSGESMLSDPSLLCFEGGEHTSMIIISIIALLLVALPFLVFSAYGVIMYPRLIASHRGATLLHAGRFLFLRYTPERYYFQVIILVRNLLLCIIPAVFRGQPSTQVLFMCMALSLYVIIEEEQQPWRSHLCNPLDASMSQILLLMLLCGALFLEDTPQRHTVSVLSSIALCGLLFFGSIGLAAGIWARFCRRRKYDFFICHHKAHAAAQARYIKTLLLKRRNCKVFIDSDNLEELDTLFDTVKTTVSHLVVYLTSDVMTRPWCVGEVVTALQSHLSITRLRTISFVPPTEEDLEDLDHYIDSSGCNLEEYNIYWDNVRDAFKRFMDASIPQIDLNPDALGTQRFELAVSALLNQAATPGAVKSAVEIAPSSVVVAVKSDCDEAIASAGILLARIAEDVYRSNEHGLHLLADYERNLQASLEAVRSASAVVIILTQECLSALEMVMTICEVTQTQERMATPPTLVTVHTPGFRFPSPKLLENLSVQLPETGEQYGDEGVGVLVRSFFKRISILLPTHASGEAIDTQCDEVYRRIQGTSDAAKTSPTRTPTSSGYVRHSVSGTSVPTSRNPSKSSNVGAKHPSFTQSVGSRAQGFAVGPLVHAKSSLKSHASGASIPSLPASITSLPAMDSDVPQERNGTVDNTNEERTPQRSVKFQQEEDGHPPNSHAKDEVASPGFGRQAFQDDDDEGDWDLLDM